MDIEKNDDMSRQQQNDGMLRQLQTEIEKLKKQRTMLQDENRALSIRAEGVQVLSKMLAQSQQEATDLKERLANQQVDSTPVAACSRQASNSGSLEKSRSEGDISLGTSPLNSEDAAYLKEIQRELHSLLEKNKELTFELESTVKEQALLNGDDGILFEHLNRLKAELDSYQSRVDGQGEWPSKLREEANRLKNKLTDIAIRRGTTCGKLQEEIDSVKLKLRDIESRISPSNLQTKFDSEARLYLPIDMEEEMLDYQTEKTCIKSPMLEPTEQLPGTMPKNYETKEKNQTEELLSQTSRTDIKQMKDTIERLTAEKEDLKSRYEALQVEKNEVVQVNHSWDAQYRKLHDLYLKEMKGRDESYYKLQRELSQEHHQAHASVKELLEQKDLCIEGQAKKIRELKEQLDRTNIENMKKMHNHLDSELEAKYQRAKKLFHEQKKENEILIQREETAMEESQMLKDAVEVLERESKSLVNRNKMLTGEIQRLANVIESSSARSKSAPQSLMYGDRQDIVRQNSAISEEQIEVLKQQIAIYAEDFNVEKEEKDKLVEEVKKLKIKLREAERRAEDKERQIRMENDLAREERFRQPRRRDIYQGIYEPMNYGDAFLGQMRRPPSPRQDYPPDPARHYQEYLHLMSERSRLDNRMAEMEQQDVDRYAQRRPDNYLNKGLAARGKPPPAPIPPNNSENRAEEEMFAGGHVVADLRKSPLSNGPMVNESAKKAPNWTFGKKFEHFRN